jgi:hypothetical protein
MLVFAMIHRNSSQPIARTMRQTRTPKTVPLSTTDLCSPALASLDTPVRLRPEHHVTFAEQGFLHLPKVLEPEALNAVRPALEDVLAERRASTPPLEQRGSAYEKAFIQVVNAGLHHAGVARLTTSRRLGKLASDLLGGTGVRIFIEDIFLKEAEGGETPWHQDQSVAPMDAPPFLTIWIPLQHTTRDMGPMRFVPGSHHNGLRGPIDISEDSQTRFQQLIQDESLPVRRAPPLALGDVTVHHGMTIHGADANQSPHDRLAVALHCFADGARIVAPQDPLSQHILDSFGPGLQPGDLAASPAWRLIHPGADHA